MLVGVTSARGGGEGGVWCWLGVTSRAAHLPNRCPEPAFLATPKRHQTRTVLRKRLSRDGGAAEVDEADEEILDSERGRGGAALAG